MDIFMSIIDFIPVVAFLIGSIFLQRDLYNKMSKGAFAVFAAGTMFVFMAGTFKAIQKILYFSWICDFVPLHEAFFPMQTTGFVLAGAGILAMVVHPQGEHKEYGIVPVFTLLSFLAVERSAPKEWDGTMLFVVLMILGVFVLDGCLVYIAVRNKCPIAVVLLIISFIGILGMGYLSTRQELSDWIKEGVNILAQGTYLAAAIVLRKKGLGRANFLVQKREKISD